MKNNRIYAMPFAKVYELLVQKVERKGRSKDEVDTVICWLTGHTSESLQSQIDNDVSVEEFYSSMPRLNDNAIKITGVVCGVRVEEIEEPIMQRIRWLDKLVDELAKGRPMEKILRS